MACPGSAAATSYGRLPAPSACAPGRVLVGFDLSYAPPSRSTGGRACGPSAECPAGQECRGGRCVAPTPGAVRGVSGLYCSAADALRVGRPGATRQTTGHAPPPGARRATFRCPAGQALAGATAWVDPTTGATEMLRPECVKFAPGAPAGLQGPAYPASLAPGSQAEPRALSVRGPPPATLFADGLAQARGPGGALAALGFGCADYAEEFDDSAARHLACCTGTAADPLLCEGFSPRTRACDDFMTRFCESDCSPAGGCLHPVCGCLGSPAGRPECYDARCADVPDAYRTAQMAEPAACPAAAPCPIWQALGDGRYLARGVAAPVDCAAPVPHAWPRGLAVVFFIVFVALLVLAISSGKKDAAALVPPPPGILP